MSIVTAAMLLADPVAAAFPEQVPGMIEACLSSAVAARQVTEADDQLKYICGGEPAERLWDFLERAKIASYEQEPAGEGRWLSRGFPLGGCFKRVRNADGSPATGGLSCTVWIPRPPADRTPSR